MRPEDIIIAPVITEKSNDGMQEGKYTFEVNKKATKVDIANAVEKLFEVKVLTPATNSSTLDETLLSPLAALFNSLAPLDKVSNPLLNVL